MSELHLFISDVSKSFAELDDNFWMPEEFFYVCSITNVTAIDMTL